MRFKRRVKLEYGLGQIDIAPMIDLFFLLFIFFMLSSTFALETGIFVKLPKAITSDAVKNENIDITITSENVVYLNGRISTIEELTKQLNDPAIKNQTIIIKADRRASVGRIVDVWDLCRKLGIERINIATNQKI